ESSETPGAQRPWVVNSGALRTEPEACQRAGGRHHGSQKNAKTDRSPRSLGTDPNPRVREAIRACLFPPQGKRQLWPDRSEKTETALIVLIATFPLDRAASLRF